MENVVLIIHLILALGLVGVVLMQRSEGGGLGIGGGGGGGRSGRPALSGLGKVTWGLAAAFIITSLTLTIIAAQSTTGGSVMDRMTDTPAGDEPATAPTADDLLPPASDDAPLAPPRAD